MRGGDDVDHGGHALAGPGWDPPHVEKIESQEREEEEGGDQRTHHHLSANLGVKLSGSGD